MTFYLKYRPKTLDELDSESVRESLKRIVSSKNIPHAFLFSGPKGIGKTSAARILAKILNCLKRDTRYAKRNTNIEPCNKCEECASIDKGNNLDVIEIDAASHRGIDDVRALRDAVKLAPAKASKKVYIIDEAHMLTPEASNALLKTLEEPPVHVYFILATTNPEKLIDTIRSRVVNIHFKKAIKEEIARSLKRVIKGENIKIDESSIQSISSLSEGSFRDAVKILEQLVLEKVKLDDPQEVEEFLFKKKAADPGEFLLQIVKGDAKEALLTIDKVAASGASILRFIDSLLEVLRLNLLAQAGIGEVDFKDFDKDQILKLIDDLIDAKKNLPYSYLEQLPLEAVAVKWCSRDGNNQVDTPNIDEDENQKRAANYEKEIKTGQNFQTSGALKEISDEIWRLILTQVKSINTSIEALLRAAKPINFDGKNLTLGVYYKFHKERLEDGSHKRILEDVVAKVLKLPVKVICTLTQPPMRAVDQDRDENNKTAPTLTEANDKDIIEVAKQIFGS